MVHSLETKQKISNSRKGKCLGNTNAKGKIPWNKGKKGVMPTPWNKDKHGFISWNTGVRNKRVICKCQVCGQEFEEFLSGIKEGRGKHCSRECADKGRTVWNKGRRGLIPEEKSGNWAGDGIGYYGLHAWVKKKFGKAVKCQICGSTDRPRYHWANTNHLYKRNLKDWISLCPSCHKKYDTQMTNEEKVVCLKNLKKI